MVEGIAESRQVRRIYEVGEEEFPNDEFDLAQTSEYLCTIGRRGYESGVKVA